MLQSWQKAIVIDVQQATHNTKQFFLQTQSTEPFSFLPGQFVTLDLPIHEQKNKRWRSYSIASVANNTNVFELIVVLLEDGAGTNYLFNNVAIGHTLNFRGPQGVFTLPTTIDSDVYFICTGTGVAPFRAMTHQLLNRQFKHTIHLIFGCRKEEDVLYKNEFVALQQLHKNFNYTICFSKEENAKQPHIKGYVHKAYNNFINNQIESQQFYLCGWKNMVDEAKENLLQMGFDKKQIHIEIYG